MKGPFVKVVSRDKNNIHSILGEGIEIFEGNAVLVLGDEARTGV